MNLESKSSVETTQIYCDKKNAVVIKLAAFVAETSGLGEKSWAVSFAVVRWLLPTDYQGVSLDQNIIATLWIAFIDPVPYSLATYLVALETGSLNGSW